MKLAPMHGNTWSKNAGYPLKPCALFGLATTRPIYMMIVPAGLGIFWFERAGDEFQAFMETAFGKVAVLGFVGSGFDVDQALLCRVGVLIFFWLQGKELDLKRNFSNASGLRGGCCSWWDVLYLKKLPISSCSRKA